MRLRHVLPAGLAATLLTGTALAAQPLLSPHVPDIVARHAATRIGAADPATVLHLAISLPLRDDAGLTAFVRDVTNPASPNYRHYLSVAQFADRFAPRAAEYRAAAGYFAGQGMHVTADAANRLMILADTDAATAARVFHVTFGRYRNPATGTVFTAPDAEPSLDLAVPVLHVTGLDDATPPRPRLIRGPGPRAAGGTGSGPGGNFVGTDIRAAYYPSGTLTGAGQSVGLMELGPYDPSGPATFFKMFGPANSVKLVNVSTDGTKPTCTGCSDGEQDLDIEYAISMAPGLAQVQVYVGRSPEAVLNRMASDNTSKILSTSWGWNENFKTDDALFREFAAQGQTNLTASGDYISLKASGPWPEEDANIIAVGGTHLVTTGPGGAWKAESAWTDSASGPSLDKTILIEPYQLPFITAANGGSKTLRNVSDISAIADFQLEICDSSGCSGGNAGTSFASPIWAGFVALADQEAAAKGHAPVGFINPAVYALAGGSGYKTEFHDIIRGRSGNFKCTPSYDLVTGVGTPRGQALLDALAGP